jgi:transcriptional regulator with XRE-family HTH domain
MKLALAAGLRERRERGRLTQTGLAHRLGSSQSRVAKMEAASKTVSLDPLVRAPLVLGAAREEVARLIRASDRVRAA